MMMDMMEEEVDHTATVTIQVRYVQVYMYLISIESLISILCILIFLGTQHQATHFGRHHGHEGHGRNGGGGGGGGGGCRTYTRGNVSATCCNGVTWYGNTPVCVGDDEEDYSASADYDYDEDEDSASADQYYAEE